MALVVNHHLGHHFRVKRSLRAEVTARVQIGRVGRIITAGDLQPDPMADRKDPRSGCQRDFIPVDLVRLHQLGVAERTPKACSENSLGPGLHELHINACRLNLWYLASRWIRPAAVCSQMGQRKYSKDAFCSTRLVCWGLLARGEGWGSGTGVGRSAVRRGKGMQVSRPTGQAADVDSGRARACTRLTYSPRQQAHKPDSLVPRAPAPPLPCSRAGLQQEHLKITQKRSTWVADRQTARIERAYPRVFPHWGHNSHGCGCKGRLLSRNGGDKFTPRCPCGFRVRTQ